MNASYFLRHFLELAILIPAAVFALLPLAGNIGPKVWAGVMCAILALCIGGAYACAMDAVPSKYVFGASAGALSAGYIYLANFSMNKKLFCLFNSAMLCEFCSMTSPFITAPTRIAEMVSGSITLIPESVHLLVMAIIGVLFFKTLTVKLPFLLNEEHVAAIWRFMFILPLVMTILLYWMVPISPVVIMTGRVRPISIVLFVFVMGTVWFVYHIFWWITVHLTESARLQQENTVLQMEAKRYEELKEYMNATKTLRHDFRQHILVIGQLAEQGQLQELRQYLSHFTEASAKNYVHRCANTAVDAVASHYDYIARTQGTMIEWKLELPAVLPMKEADFCAMLGNLVENALTAVKPLNSDARRVNVISSMLSKYMLGLSVDNPYFGTLAFGKNGLPVAGREGHGTGLISVQNTVK